MVWPAAKVLEMLTAIPPAKQRLLLWGGGCIALGLMAPRLIRVEDIGILPLAEQSIAEGSIGMLLFAVFRLVVLNTLRALPNYIGVLLIAEGLGMLDEKPVRWFKMLVLLLVPLIYGAIDLIHGIKYDFGIPAITLIFVIMLVNKNHNMSRNITHKLVVLTLLLFGVQWLDIVPELTEYGFGRGNVSRYLKDIAVFHQAENVFNSVGGFLFIIFVVNAFIIARLLNVYTREIIVAEQALKLEHLNHVLKLQSIENRALREIQSLVHDLKTPLTSIQGLAGVIAISEESRTVKRHANYISDLVDKMNTMINELLQDDKRQTLNVRELIEYAVAHVPQLQSIAEYKLIMHTDSQVEVNKIKVARALINILENAIEAVEQDSGLVMILAESDGRQVSIEVADNGKGFQEEHRESIWEAGFSTKKSSGFGLPFVRDVVRKNNGCIHIISREQGGTSVVITLPEVRENGTKNNDSGD